MKKIIQKKISKSLELAKSNDREQEYICLPREIDGIPITYEKKQIGIVFLLS